MQELEYEVEYKVEYEVIDWGNVAFPHVRRNIFYWQWSDYEIIPLITNYPIYSGASPFHYPALEPICWRQSIHLHGDPSWTIGQASPQIYRATAPSQRQSVQPAATTPPRSPTVGDPEHKHHIGAPSTPTRILRTWQSSFPWKPQTPPKPFSPWQSGIILKNSKSYSLFSSLAFPWRFHEKKEKKKKSTLDKISIGPTALLFTHQIAITSCFRFRARFPSLQIPGSLNISAHVNSPTIR